MLTMIFLSLLGIMLILACVVIVVMLIYTMPNLERHKWAAVFVQKVFYRNHVVVRVIDFTDIITYTIAQPNEDHTLDAFLFWNCKVGKIKLLPNGVVDPTCAVSYVYGWEHVDPDLQLYQQLSWPSYVEFDTWKNMSHHAKHELRGAHV